MATYVTPKRATAFVFYTGLVSQADTKLFQSNPTLATGDAKVSIDGGALADLATLPDVDPNSSKLVKVSLSTSEMTGDNIQVILSDASGAEWCDQIINIQTTARQIDDLAFPNTSGRGVDVDASGGVEVGSFQTGAITAATFAAGAIDAAAIAANAIGASEIADGAITAAKIADGAIDAATFAASAIDATALATNAVAEIAAGVLAAADVTPIAADIQEINGTTVTGDGSLSTPWGP